MKITLKATIQRQALDPKTLETIKKVLEQDPRVKLQARLEENWRTECLLEIFPVEVEHNPYFGLYLEIAPGWAGERGLFIVNQIKSRSKSILKSELMVLIKEQLEEINGGKISEIPEMITNFLALYKIPKEER